jgi:hypothetical protein
LILFKYLESIAAFSLTLSSVSIFLSTYFGFTAALIFSIPLTIVYCILLKQKIAEVEEARYQDFLRRGNVRRVWTTFRKSIGNARCINNARSPYLQCAINPTGDCGDCKDYREIVED